MLIVLSNTPAPDTIQLFTYVEVNMECYWTVNVILTDDIDRRGAEVNMSTFTVYRYISQQLFYYKIKVCYAFPVILYH